MIYNVRPDFIALSETWLGGKKHNPRFINYHAHWRHRDGGFGGGLGLLIKEGIQYQNIPLNYYANGVLEAQAGRIFDRNNRPISILNVYNPNKNLTLPELKFYIDQLDKKFIITGDFNAHSPILDDKISIADTSGKTIENLILKEPINLINPRNFYTRIGINSNTGITKSCLDLVLTSTCLSSGASLKLLEDVNSDHLPIKISINISPVSSTILTNKKWKFNEQNLLNFKQNFTQSTLIKPASAEDLASDISERILDSAMLNIPRTSGLPRQGNSTSWWDQECIDAKIDYLHSRKIVIRTPNSLNLEQYLSKQKFFKNLVTKKKQESFKTFISEIGLDTSIGSAHKKIRALKGYSPPPDSPMIDNGDIITSDKDKAELLAQYYENNAKTFSHKNLSNIENKIKNAATTPLNGFDSPITLQELLYVLKNVKNTAPGNDDIPYTLIKNLPIDALNDLLYTFNVAFSTGVFPTVWKEGTILPIHKPNKPKENPSSFRPITLLSCLGKTFEKILKRRLEYFIETKNILNPSQNGFRREQGTLDTLLRIDNEIRSSLSNNNISIFVYVDLQNAFDSIWCEGLISKLIDFGLSGHLLNILHSFLTNRKNRVKYKNEYSNFFLTEAGTPQGSILSPTLFNLMLSDLPKNDNIKQYIYADDITLSSTHLDTAIARKNMSDYLKIFSKWTKDWGPKNLVPSCPY